MSVIDVHAHFVPSGLPDMAARHGEAWPRLIVGDQPEIRQHGRRYRAVDAGYFDADVRLAHLDTIGIEVQVLSPLPVMLPQTTDGAAARDWCAAYNEGLVAICEAHPTRFRALGMLPLQAPGLALEEVARVKSLGLHGLEFGTRLDGQVELADPAMAEVFAAAADAGLPVLVHPNHGDTFGCGAPVIELGVGVGCETARAMALLHVAGTLDHCRGLRLCLSHGGGAFLWLWPRFGALAARGGASSELPACLHVDTAGLVGANLDYLATVVPPDRILFGSDMPATPPRSVSTLLGVLDDNVRSTNVERFLGGGPDRPAA